MHEPCEGSLQYVAPQCHKFPPGGTVLEGGKEHIRRALSVEAYRPCVGIGQPFRLGRCVVQIWTIGFEEGEVGRSRQDERNPYTLPLGMSFTRRKNSVSVI